jgi:acetyl-CoA carboxylase carboxyltransferase component
VTDSWTMTAPLAGTVAAVAVSAGAVVRSGTTLLIIESMKMEYPIAAERDGRVHTIAVNVGDVVELGQLLVRFDDVIGATTAASHHPEVTPTGPRLRADELATRRALLVDEARPDAMARRASQGHRSARANIAALVDADSFHEYGAFAYAAQSARRTHDDLIRNTPGDGFLGGLARVNGDLFDDEHARCAVMAYDYTVLAGTQGQRGHIKMDRLFGLAEQLRLPVILDATGGGGRPGDTDGINVTGLDVTSFAAFARLSGLVPLIGLVAGPCFAGNAALAGCCDVIIATSDSTMGMGGPAMIEGGGLGVIAAADVGPTDVLSQCGVIDIVVADDDALIATAKQYLSYFQGPLPQWSCGDQTALREVIPEQRTRVYDMRTLVPLLFDDNTVMELRPNFGVGIITALARIEGRAVGVIANNPMHLGGAIDADAADKSARFMQLCDAFDLPIVSLCDTPGFMVGPDIERRAQIRHCARMFVVEASLTVPLITIVVRKGYGLGAQSMAGGSFRSPLAIVAWPTGEFGGMGIEGAVRLGLRKELAALEEPERGEKFDRAVASMYEKGRALNMAAHLEIDDVIDPAETRDRIMAVLRSTPPVPPRSGKKRPFVDTW